MYRTEQEQKDLCEIEIRAKDGVRRRETKLMTYSTNTSIWGGRAKERERENTHASTTRTTVRYSQTIRATRTYIQAEN